MNFELFKEAGVRTKEYISVTETGTFGLPRTFINKQNLTTEHKALIFYDPAEKVVALHFTTKDSKYGLAVRIPNETQGGFVSAKSFFEVKGIDSKRYSGRYHDFKIKPLKEIGFDGEGVAYLITLVESVKTEASEESSDTSEPASQQPDLSDIFGF